MADMLQSASAWLDGMRRLHLSRQVSYTQASVTRPCLATVSQSAFETQTEMGVVERWESRDFIISVQDIPFETPKRGDIITEAVNSAMVAYEVCAPKGSPVWHWADANRTAVRIHTKARDA